MTTSVPWSPSSSWGLWRGHPMSQFLKTKNPTLMSSSRFWKPTPLGFGRIGRQRPKCSRKFRIKGFSSKMIMPVNRFWMKIQRWNWIKKKCQIDFWSLSIRKSMSFIKVGCLRLTSRYKEVLLWLIGALENIHFCQMFTLGIKTWILTLAIIL